MGLDGETEALDPEACVAGLAALLRTWRRFPLDIPGMSDEQVSSLLDAWVRHVAHAEPAPGAESTQASAGTRDWEGLDAFARELRRREQEHVLARVRDLRAAIWELVDTFGGSVAADAQSDARVLRQLERLREATRADDPAAIGVETERMAALVEGSIEAREARRRRDGQRHSAHLGRIASELLSTREKGARDDLTGFYDRAALDHHLETVVRLARVVGDTAALFVIDLDQFKWPNDRYGAAVGDELLRRIGRRLGFTLRRQCDFLARSGGDEFVAIVRSASDPQLASTAERIAFAIREVELLADGETVRVSASIGATRLARGDGPAEWLDRAQRAMDRAKQTGGDRICILDAAAAGAHGGGSRALPGRDEA